MNKLLIQLEQSGLGCHVGNYYYGSSAYADDLLLLSPSRNGLQKMFTICEKYFSEHCITISTNIDVKKSKTKCIYFSHERNNIMPRSIKMGGIPLPWVDGWNHLGNELNRNDLCWQGSSNLDHDTNNKRRKFIGKFYSLRQEFGFLKPDIFLKIINIYATSFYGGNVWNS